MKVCFSSSFRGFSKGLIVEISSLLAIFLGFSIAINFDDLISNFLYNSFNINFSLLKIFVFLITFFIIYSLVTLFAKSVTKFIKVVNLGLFNSVFGGIFGLILKNSEFNYGGALGSQVNIWLDHIAGTWGIIFILLFENLLFKQSAISMLENILLLFMI